MKRQLESGPHAVICQLWEESEAGGGVRPDGFSLHLTAAVRRAYVDEYWHGMPDRVNGRAPSSYERPSGQPYVAPGGDAVLAALIEAGGSLRYGNHYAIPANLLA